MESRYRRSILAYAARVTRDIKLFWKDVEMFINIVRALFRLRALCLISSLVALSVNISPADAEIDGPSVNETLSYINSHMNDNYGPLTISGDTVCLNYEFAENRVTECFELYNISIDAIIIGSSRGDVLVYCDYIPARGNNNCVRRRFGRIPELIDNFSVDCSCGAAFLHLMTILHVKKAQIKDPFK